MPVTRSAQKKLKQDLQREKLNLVVKKSVKEIIKKYRKNPNSKYLSQVFSILDKAGKKKVFHSNKVSRLKSRLNKFINKKKKTTTINTLTSGR